MEITNRLVYWFLDRYFERAAAFMQGDPEPVPLEANLPTEDQTIQ